MVNVIAAAVAELVEHDGEAHHDTIFTGVLRDFLILSADQMALTFRNVHGVQEWLRTVFANVIK